MRHKTLTFPANAAGAKLFQTLWHGLIIGTSHGDVKSKDQIRHEAHVQRLFCAVSDDAPAGPFAEGNRALRKDGGTVTCAIADLELLDQALQRVPWGGTDTLAVADLFDFLGAAPETDA